MLSDILKNVSRQYLDWWAGKNKNAVIYCSYFDNLAYNEKSAKIRKSWMHREHRWLLAQSLLKAMEDGNMGYVDEALDMSEVYFSCHHYSGAGFPSYFTRLGAACVAAVISSYARFYNDTVWFELEKPMEWEDIFNAPSSTFADFALKVVKKVGARLQDIAVVSMPDLGGVSDVLAALRRTENLLFDLVDYPGESLKAIESIQKIWKKFHDDVLQILQQTNNGYYTSWMEILSDRPYYPSQNDFAAMISPTMFEKFILPSLKKEMSWFDKGVYHLDGPGQIPHLDLILSIENLHAVQWVPMPSEPHHSESHYDLYKKIINSGKKVILNGYINDCEAVKKLFRHFPREAFFLTISCDSRDEAERIASLA